jgi:hypothetical protein
MFKQFFDDLAHLTKQKFNAKYTVPLLLWFLGLVLVGQLVFIFMPLKQNNEASGNIVALKIGILSYTSARFSNHSTPNYGLLITLDNGVTYDIENKSISYKVNASLKVGDYVVIYYPTKTINILSGGLASDISQLQKGNQVLYGWKEQQRQEWLVVLFILVSMGLFYGLKRHFDD